MTSSTTSFAVNGAPEQPMLGAEYRPGQCNIGPAEIARRRRAGHVGLVATVIVVVVPVAVGAPPWVRFAAALPAAGAASGYLQARLRFCAGFGSRGVYNFGPLGGVQPVGDPDARRRDRNRSLQIGLASLLVGLAVGAAAVALPL